MIPADLLQILACPACRETLVVKDNEAALQCVACARIYPIRDGIPILLVDEALDQALRSTAQPTLDASRRQP